MPVTMKRYCSSARRACSSQRSPKAAGEPKRAQPTRTKRNDPPALVFQCFFFEIDALGGLEAALAAVRDENKLFYAEIEELAA